MFAPEDLQSIEWGIAMRMGTTKQGNNAQGTLGETFVRFCEFRFQDAILDDVIYRAIFDGMLPLDSFLRHPDFFQQKNLPQMQPLPKTST